MLSVLKLNVIASIVIEPTKTYPRKLLIKIAQGFLARAGICQILAKNLTVNTN
jgi:hypothetical protein